MEFRILSGTTYEVRAETAEQALEKFYAIYGGEGCPDHEDDCACFEEGEADTIVDEEPAQDFSNPLFKRAYQLGFNAGLHCAVENALQFDYIDETQAEDLLSEEAKL